MTRYSFAQLEAIWQQAGGNAVAAPMAAAVALAESGGDPNSSNSNKNGTTDRGLWQINSIHGAQSTFDIVSNARAAVAISKNGTNWRPWCTAWSNGACGGTFMGSGSPVLKHLPTGAAPAPVTSTVTPAGNAIPGVPDWMLTPGLPGLLNKGEDAAKGATGVDGLTNTLASIYNTFTKTLWFGAITGVGLLMMFAGLALLVYQTKPGQLVAAKAKGLG